MSGVISFGRRNDQSQMWFCSGWGFSALLDTVADRNLENGTLVQALRQAKLHNGLHLELVRERSPELASIIKKELGAVAREIVQGNVLLSVNERVLEPEEVRMYRISLEELLDLLQREDSDRK
jgi:hypothetical protein